VAQRRGITEARRIMKQSKKCPKCSSTDIITDAIPTDRGYADFVLLKYWKPEALIFKNGSISKVSAYVCGTCGFTEYYADSPETLKTKPL
jgi:predicted nucleic-acid-binding Zn-ribbon protein